MSLFYILSMTKMHYQPFEWRYSCIVGRKWRSYSTFENTGGETVWQLNQVNDHKNLWLVI